jgi:predicted enzyme related to lactoylglutathione lyase
MLATMRARYAHTKLIARDWQRLARFYERVFGCVRVPPCATTSAPPSAT